MREIENLLDISELEGMSNFEKARYIYIKLGELIATNTDFVKIADERYGVDCYLECITLKDILKEERRTPITCKQVAEIYSTLLNDIGIKATKTASDEYMLAHVDTIATIDGKEYVFDLMRDAAQIQKGMKTRHFAQESVRQNHKEDEPKYETLSEEEIKKIDDKIGYTKGGIYLDDAIKMLGEEMKDEKNIIKYMQEIYPEFKSEDVNKDTILKYKIDFIFNNIKNIKKVPMGTFDTFKFYNNLLQELLTEEERKTSDGKRRYDFTITNGKNYEKYIIYYGKMEKEDLMYIYSDEEQAFRKTNKEELIQMQKDGMQYYPFEEIEELKSDDEKGR